MMSIKNENLIPILLSEYEDGLYTTKEVVWKAADLLCDPEMRNLRWRVMPSWLRADVRSAVESIEEDAELVTFGRGNSTVVKAQLLALKAWLHSHSSDE
jgi:hypothetical protein